MNAAQYKMAYGLLNKLALAPQKENIVSGFSSSGNSSMRELSHEEASAFLYWLREQDAEHKKGDKMRKRIISMAHELGWYKRDAVTNRMVFKNGKPQVDMPRIDAWCIKQGGKKLDAYKYAELPNIVTGFTRMHKSYIDKI